MRLSGFKAEGADLLPSIFDDALGAWHYSRGLGVPFESVSR
jgi:hypothetical protein